MQAWIVEGFEGDLVRLEWQDHLLDFPREMVGDARVGDVLELQQESGWFRFVVNVAETQHSKREAESALQAINGGAPEGDIQI